MKLIIDISDKTYEIIKNMVYFYNPQRSGRGETKEIFNAIKQGTPLPKGHGRLIDADEFSKRLVNASQFYRGEKADMFDTRFADGLKEADIKLVDAPTIIEADKENKE